MSSKVTPIPLKFSNLLRGSNKEPISVPLPDRRELFIKSPFDRMFRDGAQILKDDEEEPRFQVPASMDTRVILDDDAGSLVESDDEDILRQTFANLMNKLVRPNGSVSMGVYHDAPLQTNISCHINYPKGSPLKKAQIDHESVQQAESQQQHLQKWLNEQYAVHQSSLQRQFDDSSSAIREMWKASENLNASQPGGTNDADHEEAELISMFQTVRAELHKNVKEYNDNDRHMDRGRGYSRGYANIHVGQHDLETKCFTEPHLTPSDRIRIMCLPPHSKPLLGNSESKGGSEEFSIGALSLAATTSREQLRASYSQDIHSDQAKKQDMSVKHHEAENLASKFDPRYCNCIKETPVVDENLSNTRERFTEQDHQRKRNQNSEKRSFGGRPKTAPNKSGRLYAQKTGEKLSEKGRSQDGITVSLSKLKNDIEVLRKGYEMGKSNMESFQESRVQRKAQQQTLGKSAKTVSKPARDTVAQNPNPTWTQKLREMDRMARDIAPILELSSRVQSLKSHAKQHGPKPSAKDARLVMGKLNVNVPADSQSSPEKAELGSRQASQLNQSRKEAWAESQEPSARSKDLEVEQQVEGQDLQMSNSLYAKEEAMGLRPKSRRGRGIRSREYEEDAHRMAEEAPMVCDDEDSRGSQDKGKYEPAMERVEYKEPDTTAGSFVSFDEATGARPKSRRGRGMYVRSQNNYMGLTGGDNLVGEAPQLGDDERSHMTDLAQVPEVSNEDDNADQATAGSGSDQFLPKIDEARGVRPPTRRGRASARGRSSQRTDDVDGRQYSEAGNEIFSDCTTPDAPEEVDAMVVPPGAEGMEDGENHQNHVHNGADVLSQEPKYALDETQNGKVKHVANGRAHVVRDQAPQYDSLDDALSDEVNQERKEAMAVNGDELHVAKTIAVEDHVLRNNTVVDRLEISDLDLNEGAVHAENGATSSHREDARLNGTHRNDLSHSEGGREHIDESHAGIQGMWRRQEDILRLMQEKRNEIIMRAHQIRHEMYQEP